MHISCPWNCFKFTSFYTSVRNRLCLITLRWKTSAFDRLLQKFTTFTTTPLHMLAWSHPQEFSQRAVNQSRRSSAVSSFSGRVAHAGMNISRRLKIIIARTDQRVANVTGSSDTCLLQLSSGLKAHISETPLQRAHV